MFSMETIISQLILLMILVIAIPVIVGVVKVILFFVDWNGDIKGCEKYGADYLRWKHGHKDNWYR